MKVTLADPKKGKTYQKELQETESKLFLTKRIGSKIKLDQIGLSGYEGVITGGSDKEGTPMRFDVHGSARKKVLLTTGTGFKSKRKGMRKRRSVRGNTISNDIAQVNLKIVIEGSQSLEKIFGKEEPAEEAKPEEKADEKPEETPKEEAKAEQKTE